jgi:hypothetical protein
MEASARCGVFTRGGDYGTHDKNRKNDLSVFELHFLGSPSKGCSFGGRTPMNQPAILFQPARASAVCSNSHSLFLVYGQSWHFSAVKQDIAWVPSVLQLRLPISFFTRLRRVTMTSKAFLPCLRAVQCSLTVPLY